MWLEKFRDVYLKYTATHPSSTMCAEEMRQAARTTAPTATTTTETPISTGPLAWNGEEEDEDDDDGSSLMMMEGKSLEEKNCRAKKVVRF